MINIEKLIKSWEIFRDSNPYQICDGKEFRAIKEPEYCMGQMIEDTLTLLKERVLSEMQKSGEAGMKDADFVIDEIITAQDADPFDDEATTDALTDALNLIVEQRERIAVLERALAHVSKPVTLLDVFGDKYEKIVRCKDCKHYKDGFCYNPNTYDDEKTRGNTSPNWFCADGKRQERL